VLVRFFPLRRIPNVTLDNVSFANLILAAITLIGASALDWPLGAPTCIAALLATGVVSVRDRLIAIKVIKQVSWSVIPLVAGLFVIVEALQRAGMLHLAMKGLHATSSLNGILSNLTTAFGVGLLSNCMNNLPVGLIFGTAVQTGQGYPNLTQAVLVGVDLGPNLSVTGSLATILWLIALRREKVKITGWAFFTVGLVVMPFALLASVLMLWH